MEKYFVARWSNGNISLYRNKPILKGGEWWADDEVSEFVLPKEMFPEVTFENSPQEVEISLKKGYSN